MILKKSVDPAWHLEMFSMSHMMLSKFSEGFLIRCPLINLHNLKRASLKGINYFVLHIFTKFDFVFIILLINVKKKCLKSSSFPES